MKKEIRTGIMALFNALDGTGNNNDFYNDIPGRLFYKKAPRGTTLIEGDYAIFFFISDPDDDVFAKHGAEVYIQFSLFASEASDDKIDDMDTHLTNLFKDSSLTVSGWTAINMKRLQGSGPNTVTETTETGEETYNQTDVDFVISLQKN